MLAISGVEATEGYPVDRKATAWRKNRKFGDIYGGRKRLKFADNIVRRFHSLKKPGASEELPILIEDNPSRDFYFPVSAQEANEALKALPKTDHDGITHIWCRRIKRGDFEKGTNPWAEYIFGSGVRVIILYPWPKSLTLQLGTKKPSNRLRNELERFGAKFEKSGKAWVSTMTHSQLRKFYIQNLLYHEVGHHVDWYFRHWSKGNWKQVEEFAVQYAIQKTAEATYVFNQLEDKSSD